MSPSESIGERLRAERLRLGFTQDAFADQVDVGRKTQSNYESGERSPDAQYLAAAAGLGVDVGFVITGGRVTQQADTLTAKARGLLQAYESADEDLKDAIFTIATRATGVGGDVGTPRRKRGDVKQVFHGPVGQAVDMGNSTGTVKADVTFRMRK